MQAIGTQLVNCKPNILSVYWPIGEWIVGAMQTCGGVSGCMDMDHMPR